MEVKGENYQVLYDQDSATITCAGTLRLYGKDGYEPIVNLLTRAAEDQAPKITLDVSELQFLNSAGINTISKFVIQVRNQKKSQIVVKGSASFPWQTKSLKNLERLMPGLVLEID